MARRLFTILSALSLLLCVAVGVLWVRSHWRADLVSHWGPGPELGYEFTVYDGSSHLGRLGIARIEYPQGEVPGTFGLHVFTLPADVLSPAHDAHVLGFGFERREVPWDAPERQGVRSWRVSFPHWSLLVATSMPSLVWLRSRLRARLRQMRLRNTLCPQCGYDLRATPGRCPECGAVPAEVKG